MTSWAYERGKLTTVAGFLHEFQQVNTCITTQGAHAAVAGYLLSVTPITLPIQARIATAGYLLLAFQCLTCNGKTH